MAPSVDPRPVLHALGKLRISRTRIARAIGCHTQLVQCWLFGLPMDVTRPSRSVLRLVEFALNVGAERVRDNDRFGRVSGYAAEEAVAAAYELLITTALQVVQRDTERAG